MTSSVHRDWLARHPTLPLITGMPALREGDAVLACAVGRDLAEIAPFVRSLRAVFAGQVILLVDRKPTLPAWLHTHGVETVVAADRLPHWKPHASVTRFALFAQLLQDRSEIRNVILADVQDAVFQSDPFCEAPADLEFVTGAGGALPHIAVNARITKALVGETLARDLGRRPRITSGAIAGPSAAVVRFCRALLLLCGTPRAGLGAGADQTASHIIAHLGLASGEIQPNFQRVAIASCGMRIADGRIRNLDDSMSPIVLGYRRSPDLAAHIDQRWGLPPARRLGSGTTLGRTLRSLQTSLSGSTELR